jgi:hypothetical protein
MKQVIVKNLLGEQIAGAKMEDPSAWIAECEEHRFWGEAGSYSVEVVDISHEHALEECIAARKAAYPTPEEFMNAFFDGGEQAIEIMRQVRLTIKAAHPKPVKEA